MNLDAANLFMLILRHVKKVLLRTGQTNYKNKSKICSRPTPRSELFPIRIIEITHLYRTKNYYEEFCDVISKKNRNLYQTTIAHIYPRKGWFYEIVDPGGKCFAPSYYIGIAMKNM